MLQFAIDMEIKKVCPIHGISFGKLDDRSTWRIDFKEEATDQQKAYAREVMIHFNWDNQTKENYRKSIRDLECKDNLIHKKGYVDYLEKHPGSTFSNYLDYLESVIV